MCDDTMYVARFDDDDTLKRAYDIAQKYEQHGLRVVRLRRYIWVECPNAEYQADEVTANWGNAGIKPNADYWPGNDMKRIPEWD